MRPTAWATARRRIPVATTIAAQAALLILLPTGRPWVAGTIATVGIAQAVLLTLAHRRAVHAADRIADLESDLAVAYQDPVTGLAVRRVAEHHLTDAAGTDLTVALIDVDGMHAINTTHTHDGGDRFLADLAARLEQASHVGDLVARLGGDEFVLVTPRDPQTLARSLTGVLAPPITIDGITRPMAVSIGICRTPGGNPHRALGQADRAMYAAKSRGGGIAHYDPVRDGEPPAPGVRPAVRHRDRHPHRTGTS
ncbi:diguanylate cyclase domain-containing protein [Micromonospora arida]|uniref:diguanylate cyclase domain-containing protein n=1 Tax=Micromonospora arida TaxID=2203715 RepID=UPI0033EFAAC4